ncbi:MAG: hypothetical protein IJT66_05890 [Clostridia bacterium]|nr:hypothetical protein [Clostridia bacterium]
MSDGKGKRVYICAPLGGNIAGNVERAKRYTKYALFCGAAPVTPHFYALCLDDGNPKEREMGLRAGKSLLWLCDELWVFGENVTEGMKSEITFCEALGIPVRHFKERQVTRFLEETEHEEKDNKADRNFSVDRAVPVSRTYGLCRGGCGGRN